MVRKLAVFILSVLAIFPAVIIGAGLVQLIWPRGVLGFLTAVLLSFLIPLLLLLRHYRHWPPGVSLALFLAVVIQIPLTPILTAKLITAQFGYEAEARISDKYQQESCATGEQCAITSHLAYTFTDDTDNQIIISEQVFPETYERHRIEDRVTIRYLPTGGLTRKPLTFIQDDRALTQYLGSAFTMSLWSLLIAFVSHRRTDKMSRQ
jgi:hypothetical protein